MSLFGTEDDDILPSPNRKPTSQGGLFDEPSHKASSNSLFDNNDGADNQDDSPWSMPTPRKQQSRADIIRNLLPASDVPDSYISTFDTVVQRDGSGGKITSDGVAKVFASARVDSNAQASIMKALAPATGEGEDVRVGRSEFHVLLALVALAQEGEVISLDSVDERKRSMFLFSPLFALVIATIPALHPVVLRIFTIHLQHYFPHWSCDSSCTARDGGDLAIAH